MEIPEFEPQGYKIYRGAYGYLKGSNVFAEETFEVYRDRKDLSLHFKAEIHSRVATGELLNIRVNYFINKDFVPQKVLIDRRLGNDHVAEYFTYDKKRDTLNYEFIDSIGNSTRQLSTPPKFHISAPTASTSTLFLRSKKIDGNSPNNFTVFSSQNQWAFESAPDQFNIQVQKVSQTQETILIDGHNVQAMQFYIQEYYERDLLEEKKEMPFISIYLSKFAAIPYLVRSDTDQTKIQIKYFNNLDDHT